MELHGYIADYRYAPTAYSSSEENSSLYSAQLYCSATTTDSDNLKSLRSSFSSDAKASSEPPDSKKPRARRKSRNAKSSSPPSPNVLIKRRLAANARERRK